LRDIFIRIAAENHNTIQFLDDLTELRSIGLDGFNSIINYFDKGSKSETELTTTFLGEHQAKNVLTALKAFQLLDLRTDYDYEKVKMGIRNANCNFKFLGRFQVYSENPLIILDVAHNPAAFDKLIHNLDKLGLSNGLTLVLALMEDKDIEGIAKLISGKFLKYIITKPKIERAADPEYIKQKLLEMNSENEIQIIENVSDAVKHINKSEQPTLFAGSFYLIGEVLEEID
jgi:dihydrofolate synthase/folylpolyglutamate synthase